MDREQKPLLRYPRKKKRLARLGHDVYCSGCQLHDHQLYAILKCLSQQPPTDATVDLLAGRLSH